MSVNYSRPLLLKSRALCLRLLVDIGIGPGRSLTERRAPVRARTPLKWSRHA